MTDDDSHDIGRRTFLRRTAITGAVAGTAIGSTTGTAAAATAAVPPGRAEALLDAHADGVLSLLEADGVLADRTDLPTAIETDLHGLFAGTDGAALLSRSDRPTELRVVSQVAAGTLTVAVRPDDGHAYALLDTGDDTVGYSVENGRYDFGAQATCTCTGIHCGPYPGLGYYEECCDPTGCELGDCRCF